MKSHSAEVGQQSVTVREPRPWRANDLKCCLALAIERRSIERIISRLQDDGANAGIRVRLWTDDEVKVPVSLIRDQVLPFAKSRIAAIDAELAEHGVRLDEDSYGRPI